MAPSLHGRGPRELAARTATVLSRFGATPDAMERRLAHYDEVTAQFGVRPTLPVTGAVLGRHPRLIRRYAERGVEFAAHGLVHADHSLLDLREQRDELARALEIFQASGVACVGFRGPYLRYNQATLDVVRELGLRYHSSQAFLFPVVDNGLESAPGYRSALDLYRAVDARAAAVRPRLLGEVVDIPVAVPDDEIAQERLRLSEREIAMTWRRLFDLTYERGDLFTVQLHPERIFEFSRPLGETLAEARRRRPHVWTARLDEIDSWWRRRATFALTARRLGPARVRVCLRGDADATLLSRGLAGSRHAPWSDRYELAGAPDFEAATAVLPVVAVSPRSPDDVRAFLAEEGFPLEISADPRGYGAHVDVSGGWEEQAVLDGIDAAPGPLVRLGRWPRGARSALAVTGDIDSVTLQDFVLRYFETRRSAISGRARS